MRGEILSVDGLSGDGLISGDDGVRYPFPASAVRRAVQPGDKVDFVPVDGAATDVIPIPSGAAATPAGAPAMQYSRPRDTMGPWGYFIRAVTRKYAEGNGRATRGEYWSFVLFYWLFLIAPALVGAILDGVMGLSTDDGAGPFGVIGVLISGVVFLGLWLPGICVLIRRFHDVGLSGWLILIGLVPYAGGLFTFVVSLLNSQYHPNTHGPVPGTGPRRTADVFG